MPKLLERRKTLPLIVLFSALSALASAQSPIGSPPPPPPPPPPPGMEANPAPSSPDIGKPQRDASALQMLPPVYPRIEAYAGLGGAVVLILDIDAAGNTANVSIEQSSRNRDLDRAAMTAARSWTFSPAMRDGVDAPSRLRIPVDFSPGKRPANCLDVGFESGTKKAIEKGSAFKPDDVIRVSFEHDVAWPTTFEATWSQFNDPYFKFVGQSGSATKTIDQRGPQRIELELSPPQDGWPSGKYSVGISINKQRAALAFFEVEG